MNHYLDEFKKYLGESQRICETLSHNQYNASAFSIIRFEELIKKIKDDISEYAIYGTGDIANELYLYLKDKGLSSLICCFLDRVKSIDKIDDKDVLDSPLYAIEKFGIKKIIIASSKYENVIYDRLVNLKLKDVDIIKIYDWDDFAEERVYFTEDISKGIKMLPYLASVYQAHLNRYMFALGYADKKSVLDMACGSGYGSALLSAVASEVCGVDISKDAVDFAKEHYRENNLRYVEGSVDSIRLDHKYDVVVSFETIEHIVNVDAYFETVKYNLSETGLFIVSTPMAENDGQSITNKYHTNEFTRNRFIKYLESNFSRVIIFRQIEEEHGAIYLEDDNSLKDDANGYIIAVCWV